MQQNNNKTHKETYCVSLIEIDNFVALAVTYISTDSGNTLSFILTRLFLLQSSLFVLFSQHYNNVFLLLIIFPSKELILLFKNCIAFDIRPWQCRNPLCSTFCDHKHTERAAMK